MTRKHRKDPKEREVDARCVEKINAYYGKTVARIETRTFRVGPDIIEIETIVSDLPGPEEKPK